MKWFQHQTTAYADTEHEELRAEFGMEGYGFYWLCLELVGSQGTKQRLRNTKKWRKKLKITSSLSEEKLDKTLKKLAELNLISRNALKNGELYIPHLRKYSDDYTKQLRRRFVETSLRIDKIRIDKIIREYIRLKGWEETTSKKPELMKEVYSRNTNVIKKLLRIADNDNFALRALKWTAQMCQGRGLSWTLETVIKFYPEWETKYGEKQPDRTSQDIKDLGKGIGRVIEAPKVL